jgi:hypothetical protein
MTALREGCFNEEGCADVVGLELTEEWAADMLGSFVFSVP